MGKIRNKKVDYFIALILIIFGFSINLSAHRVNIFAEPIGDKIALECYYSNGDKVHQGKITVIEGKNGAELLSDETDGEGKLTFKIPEKTIADKSGIKIVLDAGMGHRGVWDISYKEIKGSLNASKKTIELKENNINKKEANTIKKSEVKPVQIIIGLAAIFVIFGILYFIKIVKRKKD